MDAGFQWGSPYCRRKSRKIGWHEGGSTVDLVMAPVNKDEWGQRDNIEIELQGIGDSAGKASYNSGWMIQSDG